MKRIITICLLQFFEVNIYAANVTDVTSTATNTRQQHFSDTCSFIYTVIKPTCHTMQSAQLKASDSDEFSLNLCETSHIY